MASPEKTQHLPAALQPEGCGDVSKLTTALRDVEPSASSSSPQDDSRLPLSSPANADVSEAEAELYKGLLKHVATERQLGYNGYPRLGPKPGTASITYENPRRMPPPVYSLGENKFRYTCERCLSTFTVDHSGPYDTGRCIYHYGKKRKTYGGPERHLCCEARAGTTGCTEAQWHVWDGRVPGKNPAGYVQTEPRLSKLSAADSSIDKVYSLDCEMSYTAFGLELCRITVIDYKCKVVLDSLVKPSTPIVDYNTRFSGVAEKDLDGVNVSLEDIQQRLLSLFSAETILVGHSLENDLGAVKMIHSRVVDTSLAFPHRRGGTFRRSLRELAKDNLGKIIQAKGSGHDSREDASIPMELMIKKVQQERRQASRYGRHAASSLYY